MTENPYLQPTRIRAALNSLGLRPSRDLGQNFLHDADALAAIVDAAELQPSDIVVEVGPGLGVLTYEIAARSNTVYAIEFDKRLAARLGEELKLPNLHIIDRDVLRVKPAEFLGEQSHYKVVANLPYHITSAVLRHFLEAQPAPDLIVVMVQWEVAERITAAPPDMSVLAHSVQYYAEPEIIARVPAASFVPIPRVDSAVLRLRRRPHPQANVADVNAFFRLIKAGFLHARKKLGNSLPAGLAAMGTPIDKPSVIAALEAVGVDPSRRAESLTLAEWSAAYRRLGLDERPTAPAD